MKWVGAVSILLLLSVLILIPGYAHARSIDVTLIQGSSDMIVRGYEPVNLTFSVKNIFENRSLDIEVQVTKNDLYSVKIYPSSAFRLRPQQVENVSVLIIPSKNVERQEFKITVTFQVYEPDGILPIESKEETVRILFINPSLFLQPLIKAAGGENNWVMQFVITVAFWALIGFLAVFVIGPLIMHFVEKTRTKIDDIVWHIVRVPTIILLFLYGLVEAMNLMPLDVSILAFINQVYNFIVIATITYVVYKLFKDILVYEGQRLAKKTKSELDDVLIPVLEKIGSVIILIAGSMWALSAVGIDITIFLAGIGGTALILGLAAQDVLANFFAGMHILLDRPFKVGDYVKIEGSDTVYRIVKVGVRSTQAYDVFNHEMVIIPNIALAGDRIVNMMKPDEMGKVKFSVGVAYGTDVDRVQRIIEEVVSSHPEIVKDEDKKPLVRLVEFGDSSLNFTVIAWIPNIMDQWRVAHELRVALYKRFQKEGIEIPFPQLDVHIKDGSVPSESGR